MIWAVTQGVTHALTHRGLKTIAFSVVLTTKRKEDFTYILITLKDVCDYFSHQTLSFLFWNIKLQLSRTLIYPLPTLFQPVQGQ